jgi:hypothetical protein
MLSEDYPSLINSQPYEESKDQVQVDALNPSVFAIKSECCYIKFVLTIQDFGCGIPADKLDSIFINFGNLSEH